MSDFFATLREILSRPGPKPLEALFRVRQFLDCASGAVARDYVVEHLEPVARRYPARYAVAQQGSALLEVCQQPKPPKLEERHLTLLPLRVLWHFCQQIAERIRDQHPAHLGTGELWKILWCRRWLSGEVARSSNYVRREGGVHRAYVEPSVRPWVSLTSPECRAPTVNAVLSCACLIEQISILEVIRTDLPDGGRIGAFRSARAALFVDLAALALDWVLEKPYMDPRRAPIRARSLECEGGIPVYVQRRLPF